MSLNKQALLGKIKLKKYRIYGIFDFETQRIVYINLDMNSVKLEYDIEDYDEERYDIIFFDIILG